MAKKLMVARESNMKMSRREFIRDAAIMTAVMAIPTFALGDKKSGMKIKQIRNATLLAALERRGLAGRVLMPADGEEYVF